MRGCSEIKATEEKKNRKKQKFKLEDEIVQRKRHTGTGGKRFLYLIHDSSLLIDGAQAFRSSS